MTAGRDAATAAGDVHASLVIPHPASAVAPLLPPSVAGPAVATGALGVLETTGYATVVSGADAMVKAADVELVRLSIVSGGRVVALVQGPLDSVQAAREICNAPHVHLTGYCIGGTMVAALMAWLNRQDSKGKAAAPVAHWSLLTTLVDFANPGDVDVFITEAGVEHLEHAMTKEGFLDGKDMSTTFRM